ncbi:MAG: hypothetical protein M1832_003698 [Thelocarpon impressellum]|nr:MAG: hypothetical protein M1832_003698 [Thelocarpon impressellum]
MEGPTGTSDLTTQEIDFLFNPQSDIDFTAWFTNLDQDMPDAVTEPQTAQPEVQPENEWQELTTAHSAWPTLSMQGIALPGLALPPASGPGADDLQSLPIQGATLPGGIAQVLFEPNQVFPLVDAGFAVPDPQDNLVAYPTKCTLDQMLGLDGLSEGQPKVSSEPYKAACSDSSDEQPAKHRKRQGGKARGQLPEPARGYKPEIALDQPWVRVNYTTLGKNRRPAKIVAFDPKTAYDHLQETPEPWDGFEYNWAGELRTGRAYSTSQLRRYLYDHPLHSYNGEERDTKRSRLRILIQRAPADSARRRPTAASEMCRWMKCPCPRKVIRVGHFRVAFDEQGWKKGGLREHHDPYVNAGYLHLYCAEKIFDFPEAVGQLNVRADTRKLKREPGGVNRMGLGAARVAPEAEDFLTECNATGAPANYPRLADYPAGKRPYVGTLNHRLQLAKTEREMPCRQRRREELGDRPGQVQNHLGDLEAVVLDRHNKRKRTCVSKAISYAATVEAGSEHDTSKSIGSQTPHIASRRQRKRQPEVAAYTGDGDDEQNSTSEVEEVPRPRKKARG